MTPQSLRVRGMGIDLHVLEWAPLKVARGTVVLVHGFQDVAWSWDLVAPHLVELGFRVLAHDQRGFGDSDRVPDGGYYYFPDYVFDLTELVDALCPSQSIALVGHSMGGNVATMYAGLFPDRVTKLALLEGVGPPSFGEDMVIDRELAWIEGVRKMRSKPEKPMTFAEVVRRLSIGHPSVREDVIKVRARQLSKPIGDDQYVWRFDPLHRTRSPIPFSIERWRTHAERVTADTLCVGGGTTGFHPPDEAARIATIPGARGIELEGAGHMMHWTKPEEVAQILGEFLTASATLAR
jgi:pimeloyl-ACP methyl ester carboxylesterase